MANRPLALCERSAADALGPSLGPATSREGFGKFIHLLIDARVKRAWALDRNAAAAASASAAPRCLAAATDILAITRSDALSASLRSSTASAPVGGSGKPSLRRSRVRVETGPSVATARAPKEPDRPVVGGPARSGAALSLGNPSCVSIRSYAGMCPGELLFFSGLLISANGSRRRTLCRAFLRSPDRMAPEEVCSVIIPSPEEGLSMPPPKCTLDEGTRTVRSTPLPLRGMGAAAAAAAAVQHNRHGCCQL